MGSGIAWRSPERKSMQSNQLLRTRAQQREGERAESNLLRHRIRRTTQPEGLPLQSVTDTCQPATGARRHDDVCSWQVTPTKSRQNVAVPTETIGKNIATELKFHRNVTGFFCGQRSFGSKFASASNHAIKS